MHTSYHRVILEVLVAVIGGYFVYHQGKKNGYDLAVALSATLNDSAAKALLMEKRKESISDNDPGWATRVLERGIAVNPLTNDTDLI